MVTVVQIKQDLNAALKAGEALVVSVLRMLLSELNYKQIELQRELNEGDIAGVVGREVKKRKEAMEAFTAGGRPEQAATEKQELEILQAYLPAQMNQQEIEMEIEKILKDKKFSNFGEAMREISPIFKGKADGGVVAAIVKEKLG